MMTEQQNEGGLTLEQRAAAIAAAHGTDAADEAKRLAEMDAALEAVPGLLALSVDKLAAALAGVSLFTLRLALAAESSEGGKARKGAIEAIEAAIDAHPDQIAALEGAGAAENGGAIDMPLEVGDGAELGADRIAAATEGSGDTVLEEAPFSPERITFADESAEWNDEAVLAYLKQFGAHLIVARQAFAHPELPPVAGLPEQFTRVGNRVTFDGDIELNGVGLAHPLALEQVWLIVRKTGGPTIIRRCDVQSVLNLEPGQRVKFPAKTLIF